MATHAKRKDPETLRLRAIVPSLTVNDLDASVRFYAGVLGFVVGERWEEGGKLLGLMLKAGTCEIGLSQDDFKKGRDRQKGVGVRLWCHTAQDVDALAARIKAAGGKLAQQPRDEMGGRRISIDDPDGYHISFEHRPEPKRG
jgi:predicted enzyme related to lactoylglutathione lyase